MLIDVLYELVKWTSSSNYFVREAAEQSLQLLSEVGQPFANL
jgi:hypothetical protein